MWGNPNYEYDVQFLLERNLKTCIKSSDKSKGQLVMELQRKLSSIREISKAQLSKILFTNPNFKYLVIVPNLIRPLEKICSVQWLK